MPMQMNIAEAFFRKLYEILTLFYSGILPDDTHYARKTKNPAPSEMGQGNRCV
jgi:hypothetical protein